MKTNAAQGVQIISLLILGAAVLFDLPVWFGFIGFALGLGGVFMTTSPAK